MQIHVVMMETLWGQNRDRCKLFKRKTTGYIFDEEYYIALGKGQICIIFPHLKSYYFTACKSIAQRWRHFERKTGTNTNYLKGKKQVRFLMEKIIVLVKGQICMIFPKCCDKALTKCLKYFRNLLPVHVKALETCQSKWFANAFIMTV